jgi:hypothetical protein
VSTSSSIVSSFLFTNTRITTEAIVTDIIIRTQNNHVSNHIIITLRNFFYIRIICSISCKQMSGNIRTMKKFCYIFEFANSVISTDFTVFFFTKISRQNFRRLGQELISISSDLRLFLRLGLKKSYVKKKQKYKRIERKISNEL